MLLKKALLAPGTRRDPEAALLSGLARAGAAAAAGFRSAGRLGARLAFFATRAALRASLRLSSFGLAPPPPDEDLGLLGMVLQARSAATVLLPECAR